VGRLSGISCDVRVELIPARVGWPRRVRDHHDVGPYLFSGFVVGLAVGLTAGRMMISGIVDSLFISCVGAT
jgi:hypothetical protein